MLLLHFLHFPPRSKKDTTGILSYHAILFLHLGHILLPLVNEIFFGMRQLIADIKDPKTNPNTKTKMYSINLYYQKYDYYGKQDRQVLSVSQPEGQASPDGKSDGKLALVHLSAASLKKELDFGRKHTYVLSP